MNADIGFSTAAGQNPLGSNSLTSPTDSTAASPTKQADAKGSIQPKFEWGDLWRSIEPIFKHIVGVYGPIAGEGFTQGAKFAADWADKNQGSSPNVLQVLAAGNELAEKSGHTGEYKIAFTTGFAAGAFAGKTFIGTGRAPTFNDVQFHLKLIDDRYQGVPFVPDIRYVPEPSRQGTPGSTRQ